MGTPTLLSEDTKKRIEGGLRNVRLFAKGEEYDPDIFFRYLTDLCDVVISKHFRGVPCVDEMVSIGLSKSVDLLRAAHLDLKKNLRNYLYSGIRNEIGNHLRRELKQTDPSFILRRSSLPIASRPRVSSVAVKVVAERDFGKSLQRFVSCVSVLEKKEQVDKYVRLSWGAAVYRAVSG